MKTNRIVTLLTAFVLMAGIVSMIGALALGGSSYLASVLPAVVETLTNTKRAENNVAPLIVNDRLTQAAQLKAEDMATRGYFSHNTPEGYLPWYWLQIEGYQYSHAGENLAVDFNDSKDVVDAWMNSPSHRANIVKSVYTEIGVGTATGTYNGRPAVFVVQFFGTPLSATSTK